MIKRKPVARRKRRSHAPEFKAQVALAALREDKTMAQLCREFELAPQQIMDWKRQLLEGAGDVFGADRDKTEAVDFIPLQAKIGLLTLENDFWLRRNKPFGQLLAFTEAGRF